MECPCQKKNADAVKTPEQQMPQLIAASEILSPLVARRGRTSESKGHGKWLASLS
jgi:hypothetical protein